MKMNKSNYRRGAHYATTPDRGYFCQQPPGANEHGFCDGLAEDTERCECACHEWEKRQ